MYTESQRGNSGGSHIYDAIQVVVDENPVLAEAGPSRRPRIIGSYRTSSSSHSEASFTEVAQDGADEGEEGLGCRIA